MRDDVVATYASDGGKTLTREVLLEAVNALQPAPAPVRLHVSALLVEDRQYRFPKKRRNRRWVKKFRKKYSGPVPSDDVYYFFTDGIQHLVCHPANRDAVIKKLASTKPVTVRHLPGLGPDNLCSWIKYA